MRGVPGIRLDQDAFQIQGAEQLLEDLATAGFTGVVSLLQQGDAKHRGINRYLGDKAVMAVVGFADRAPQSPAVTDQLIQTLCAIGDLTDHPGLQNLAVAHGFSKALLLQVGRVVGEAFREAVQVLKRGIGRPALGLQTQRLVERFPVPAGKTLQIP